VTAPLFSVANSPSSSQDVLLGERRLRSSSAQATLFSSSTNLVMGCPWRIVEVAASLACLLYSLRQPANR
jgi:hypothetical protein